MLRAFREQAATQALRLREKGQLLEWSWGLCCKIPQEVHPSLSAWHVGLAQKPHRGSTTLDEGLCLS